MRRFTGIFALVVVGCSISACGGANGSAQNSEASTPPSRSVTSTTATATTTTTTASARSGLHEIGTIKDDYGPASSLTEVVSVGSPVIPSSPSAIPDGIAGEAVSSCNHGIDYMGDLRQLVIVPGSVTITYSGSTQNEIKITLGQNWTSDAWARSTSDAYTLGVACTYERYQGNPYNSIGGDSVRIASVTASPGWSTTIPFVIIGQSGVTAANPKFDASKVEWNVSGGTIIADLAGGYRGGYNGLPTSVNLSGPNVLDCSQSDGETDPARQGNHETLFLLGLSPVFQC